MVLAVLSCMCEHHPIRCGNVYASFGHYGWGEPYIRMSRCPDCDYCGQRGGAHGIKGLDPRKQDIQKWVDDHEADLAPRKNRCSYAIRDRLSRRFSQALELRRNGTKKHPECGCDFLFEIEVGTIWHEGAKGLEWRFDGDYNPYELAWVINPTELYQDISEQEATCPICDSKLFLMLHEG